MDAMVPMVSLSQLWLAVVLAGVAVFVASAIIHMVLKYHNSDYRGFPNEDEVAAAECLSLCDGQLRSYAAAFPDLAACDASGITPDAEFEIGEAVFDPDDLFLPPTYRTLEDGGTMTVVRGGQGLLMLPFALRGKEFVITEDPNDWGNPRMPKVDMWVDIDGYNLVPYLTGKEAQQILKLVEALEDHEDVQHVWANFDIEEAELVKLAG